MRTLPLIALAVLAVPVSLAAQSRDLPPVGWRTDPASKFLDNRLNEFIRRKPEQAAEARDLGKRYEARIDEYRNRIKAEIDTLAAEQVELRKQGYRNNRDGWNKWFARNRELYEPLEKILEEFKSEITALSGEPKPRVPVGEPGPLIPAPSSGSRPPPPLPPRPSTADNGPWATPEQVQAALGNLPALPEESRFQAAVDNAIAGRTLDEKQTAEVNKQRARAGEKLKKLLASRGREIAQLQDVIRIVQAHPSSIRASDLPGIRDHWMLLIQEADEWNAELESDLKKILSRGG
jgi:hypothetical protein